MNTVRVLERLAKRPCAEDLVRLGALSTVLVSDNLVRDASSPGLLPVADDPFAKGAPMMGTALTVRTRPGHNLAVHVALGELIPGDVLVVQNPVRGPCTTVAVGGLAMHDGGVIIGDLD